MHFLFTTSNNFTASFMQISFLSDKHEPNTCLVEVNGIEPMTYSLQSYRSPN